MRLNAEIAIFFTVLGIIAFSFLVPPQALLVLMLAAVGIFLMVSRSIRYLNDRNVEQFAYLNEELKLKLNTTDRSWFKLDWQYPSLSGTYLNRNISIIMFNADSFGITAPHTRIAVDALHYDKTLEIKSEGIYTQFEKMYFRATNFTNRIIRAILKYFGRYLKPISHEVNIGDLDFDRRFYIISNDTKFTIKLLDKEIRDIMTKDVFLKMGKFELRQSQLFYTEQIVINTDFERQRLQKIILLMYMIAKRIEQIR